MTKNGAFPMLILRVLVAAVLATLILGAPLSAAAQPSFGSAPASAAPAAPTAPGLITGLITGLRVCDNPGGPLNRATILVTTATFSMTLESEPSGNYSVFLDPADSPVTLDIGHTGYVTQTVTGVPITSGGTTIRNLNLRADAPCLAPLPGALQSFQRAGLGMDKPLTLGNTGASDLTWGLAARPAAAPGAGRPALSGVDLIHDGGFEDGSTNPFWQEYSSQNPTPLCKPDDCDPDGQATGTPHTGTGWVWFGGANGLEHATITQTVRIPTGSASLSFWVWLQQSIGSATDTLSLTVDNQTLWTTYGNATGFLAGYAQVTLNLAAFADGQSHVIVFDSRTNGPATGTNYTSFMLDDVVLDSQPQPCPGNIAWLSLPSTAGSVSPAGAASVSVHFDSTGLTGTQPYAGTLCLASNDALNAFVEVPVSMTVLPPRVLIPLLSK